MFNPSDPLEAMALLKQGHKVFDLGDFQKSAMCFLRAMQIVEGLPEEIKFDRQAFIAACNVGLSGALGSLGQPEASLACAEAALNFYEPYGPMYPVEYGNWLMARFNRGAALANLGRLDEALEAIEQAQTMLSDGPEAAEWRSKCEQSIQKIKTAKRKRQSSKKKKWQFWK